MFDSLKVLVGIDWAAVFSFFAYVISSAALPIASRLLLTELHFSFPSTLAAVHAVATSLCLVFWTFLSIFKPRTMRLSRLLPLSVMHSLVSLSHVHNLYQNSLLHYQLARSVPLLALSWIAPSTSSVPDSDVTELITKRARVIRGIFILVSSTLVALHPPKSPLLFLAAIVVPMFDLNGKPQQMRLSTRATDLQLQLTTRSLSAVFLCVTAPALDTKYTTRLLNLMSTMITDFNRPASFFLYLSALLTFFTFVSVRVAHAKLEPYVFRTASVLAAVPPLVFHFVMDTTSAARDRTTNSDKLFHPIALGWHVFDVFLILALLATVHHITMSTMPGYDRENTGRIDDIEAGENDEDSDIDDGGDDDINADGSVDVMTLRITDSRSLTGGGNNFGTDEDENPRPSNTERRSDREFLGTPSQVATTPVSNELINSLGDDPTKCCTINVSPSYAESQ